MTENLFRCGSATMIGSLPHLDSSEAAALAVSSFPDLPAAPSLPQSAGGRDMIASALDRVGPDEAFNAFLAALDGHDGWVKIQVAGPITLAMELHRCGAEFVDALRDASNAASGELDSQIRAIKDVLPGARILATLDEPSIAIMTEQVSSVDRMRALDEISRVFAALDDDITTGLHCCAETDWSVLFETGPTVVFAPLNTGILDAPGALGAHLDRGGWVCWGVVPTSQPVGLTGDHIWKRLALSWCDLVQAGCDPIKLRTQALVSPECGLGLHGVGQVDGVIEVTNRVAERVHDQVVAVRFAMGA